MVYVTNVEVGQQSPAQNDYNETQRLTKLIESIMGYVAICEDPTVNRLDEAADLRRHAHDLQYQKEQLVERLTGNNQPQASAESPMVLGQLQSGRAAQGQAANYTGVATPGANNVGGQESPLVLGQMR